MPAGRVVLTLGPRPALTLLLARRASPRRRAPSTVRCSRADETSLTRGTRPAAHTPVSPRPLFAWAGGQPRASSLAGVTAAALRGRGLSRPSHVGSYRTIFICTCWACRTRLVTSDGGTATRTALDPRRRTSFRPPRRRDLGHEPRLYSVQCRPPHRGARTRRQARRRIGEPERQLHVVKCSAALRADEPALYLACRTLASRDLQRYSSFPSSDAQSFSTTFALRTMARNRKEWESRQVWLRLTPDSDFCVCGLEGWLGGEFTGGGRRRAAQLQDFGCPIDLCTSSLILSNPGVRGPRTKRSRIVAARRGMATRTAPSGRGPAGDSPFILRFAWPILASDFGVTVLTMALRTASRYSTQER